MRIIINEHEYHSGTKNSSAVFVMSEFGRVLGTDDGQNADISHVHRCEESWALKREDPIHEQRFFGSTVRYKTMIHRGPHGKDTHGDVLYGGKRC